MKTSLVNERILLVEDEGITRTSLQKMMLTWGCQVDACESAEEASVKMQENVYTVVLTDVQLPGRSGIELLRDITAKSGSPAVIIMTAYSTISAAVEAMKAGAHTYLSKPVIIDELRLTLERLAERRQDKAELAQLRNALGNTRGFAGMTGNSPAMRKVYTLIERIADSPSSVLILGESGTGKELAARAIHRQSGRQQQRFVAIDCGALPATLLESELFGHEAGAFTGATHAKAGLFEVARGGTLFLDEIAEASPEVQAKLLRALQERVIRRLGGTTDIACDTRVLCATNRDLDALVAEGKFRAELLYRIRVITLKLPPLRERDGDLPLLIDHFVRTCALRLNRPVRGVTPAALQKLQQHAWPGNIRELANVIEAAVNVADGPLLDEQLFTLSAPPAATVLPAESAPAAYATWDYATLKREQVRRLDAVFFPRLLAECRGNISAAGRQCGLDRKHLYAKLRDLGLDVREERRAART